MVGSEHSLRSLSPPPCCRHNSPDERSLTDGSELWRSTLALPSPRAGSRCGVSVRS